MCDKVWSYTDFSYSSTPTRNLLSSMWAVNINSICMSNKDKKNNNFFYIMWLPMNRFWNVFVSIEIAPELCMEPWHNQNMTQPVPKVLWDTIFHILGLFWIFQMMWEFFPQNSCLNFASAALHVLVRKNSLMWMLVGMMSQELAAVFINSNLVIMLSEALYITKIKKNVLYSKN